MGWGEGGRYIVYSRFLSFSGDVLGECSLLVLVITRCLARVVCALDVIQKARLVVLAGEL
jgi:hypothetical protein